MKIQKINFTSSAFATFSFKQPVQTNPIEPQTIAPMPENDRRNAKNRTNNIKKYTLIGAGVLLAAVLIFKGKSILSKFKKKVEIPDIEPPREEVKPPVVEINTQTTNVKPPKPDLNRPAQEVENAVQEAGNSTHSGRYSLVAEYDRLTKARSELRKKTQGRELTPEEKSESERLRIEWGKVYKRLVPEHQSIVERKTAKDFATVEEKEHYIMNYVLPRMNKSEESALDALDMFEQFGFRADYPSKLDTTITKLTLGITTLPKECKSDKVLNRFIDVFEKFSNNKTSKHPDDEELAEAIANFATKGQPIKEETVLRGIELMKKIACQNWVHERLDYALVSSYEAKFKTSEAVKNALGELKEVVKDMKYRLGADDR